MNLTANNIKVTIPFNIERTAKSSLYVIEKMNGFKLKSHNKIANTFLISSGMSATSWGEDISMQLTKVNELSTEITISSSSKTGMLAGGTFTPKNQMNLDALINNITLNLEGKEISVTSGSDKSAIKVLLFLMFFGYFGAHHFYLGKKVRGVLYLLTCGFFFVGVLIDLIILIMGRMEDKEGNLITNW